MDLKAKLEAVIYAAEEPVTLAQLAQLFAEDALAWKAEQQAALAAANEPEESADSLPLLLDELPAGLAAERSPAAEEPSTTSNPAPPIADTESAPAPEASSTGPESAADPEADAKRLARQRDREVRAILRQHLDELIRSCTSDSRGIEIREIAGGFRMATKPACHDAVRAFVKSLKPALKLSLPALETLAVIAYKQPVTAPEVNEIRGVDSSGVFGSLLARKLIATAGRKQVIGRPILYKTTREFLLRFGLNDVAELPSMEEFEKMAVELEDSESDGEPDTDGAEPMGPEDTESAIQADLELELQQPADSDPEPASAAKTETTF
jgi:segregation and condensation protein B